jgi:hypothetical protein
MEGRPNFSASQQLCDNKHTNNAFSRWRQAVTRRDEWRGRASRQVREAAGMTRRKKNKEDARRGGGGGECEINETVPIMDLIIVEEEEGGFLSFS